MPSCYPTIGELTDESVIFDHRSWLPVAGATAVHLNGRADAQGEPGKTARAAYEYKVFDTSGIASKEKELNQLGTEGLGVRGRGAIRGHARPDDPFLEAAFEKNTKDNLSSVDGATKITREPGYLLFRRQK